MTDLEDKDIGVREGDVLAGKYRVDRILGVGGMGVVVAAHHVQLDDRVAIKFLLPEMLGSTECVSRFAREARAAVKIKSEHVARVTDVGKLESGSPYMVMEYLEGEDLSAWIARGPLRVEQAVDFVLQACEAIAEAHSLDIVHRDLKPANLFCVKRPGGQPSIKVLDFGISKLGGGPQDVSMTRTTAIIGSPVYMSPEQMTSSKSVDLRTDIWALGVILFELVTGRPPFGGDTVTEVAIHIAMDPTPPPRSLRPDLPPGLDAAITKCLEKDRARRFQNVRELACALVEFGSKRAGRSFEEIDATLRASGDLEGTLESEALSRAADARLPSASPPEARHGSTIAAWQRTGPGSKRAGKAIAGAVTAAVVLAGVAGALVVTRRGESAASPGPLTGLAISTVVTAPPPASVVIAPAALEEPPPATPAAPVVAASAPKAAAARGPHPAPPLVAPAHSAPAPAAKPSCNPPYVIDAAGDRKYKPECL
jgi:serine/threonine-protein kinase